MVDSCLKCPMCKRGEENWCLMVCTFTYGGKNRHGRSLTVPQGQQTKGGYCTKMVVHERFAIHIPPSYPLEAAGPIMCAGITVYDPMRAYGVRAGTRVGVVGLGGLGITAIKIAKALGCVVTGISRGEAKRQLAIDAGAEVYVATSSAEQMKRCAGSIDLLIDTIPTKHDYSIYIDLLDNDVGKIVFLGLTDALIGAAVCDIVMCGRSRVGMGNIGGTLATQEIINLADKHKIIPHTKIVPVSELNRIIELQDSGNDAGIRYVLDITGSLTEDKLDGISCGEPPKLNPYVIGLTKLGIVQEVFKMSWQHVCCAKRRKRWASKKD